MSLPEVHSVKKAGEAVPVEDRVEWGERNGEERDGEGEAQLNVLRSCPGEAKEFCKWWGLGSLVAGAGSLVGWSVLVVVMAAISVQKTSNI